MKQTSIFDVISPIMIGPSSSHTAGAVRLGLLARNIYNRPFQKIVFRLYNSYALTGKGHGTEKGLLAGVMGFGVDDRRIKDVFEHVENIDYAFEYEENFKKHPNSVDFIFDDMKIYGESIGAGEVLIRKIDDFEVELTGKYNTLVLVYDDVAGMISKVTTIIQQKNINIATLHCDRYSKGGKASMVICIDGELDCETVCDVKALDKVYFVTYVKKLDE